MYLLAVIFASKVGIWVVLNGEQMGVGDEGRTRIWCWGSACWIA